MSRLLAVIIVFFSVAWASPSFAQLLSDEYDWLLKRDRSGIKVYTAAVEGSKYRAVSATMVVEGRVESLVGLVMDLANCPNWAALCKLAQLESKTSSTEAYVYTLNDLPFPVRDRDVFSHVIWQFVPSTGAIRMRSRALNNYKPRNKGIVRVTDAVSEWVFTPQKYDKVLVQSFVHVDPNGPIPAWIVNRLVVGSPFKTMLRMREIVEAGGYAGYQLNF